MELVHNGYRGLELLFDLNWDRLLYLATVAGALGAGAYVGTLIY